MIGKCTCTNENCNNTTPPKYGILCPVCNSTMKIPIVENSATLEQDAIEEALQLAFDFGITDGGHHKMWVIDQMVRKLTKTPEGYEKFIKEYEGEDGEYEWDTGIAP